MNEFEQEAEAEQLRQVVRRLEGDVARAKRRSADLVAATYAGARDAMVSLGPVPTVPKPKADRRSKAAEVALWHLTDWQGAKVTPDYNSDVMVERVMRFGEKAGHLTDLHRSHHPVRECVVVFGGDMVEGLFNYPAQLWEIDASLFGQFTRVSRLLVDIVRVALATYEKVKVVAEWGNHGRVGSKRDNVPPADNIDRMCYEFARQLLADEKRLTWEDCPTGIQRLEVGEYRALVCHGDEPGRTGYVAPTTFQAWANRQRVAYPWTWQDMYVGHYHRHAQEPLADGVGAIYWTGSTESSNGYALEGMAASAVPSQRLHFIDPERGRVTSAHQVWVDD
jgi:hypothetical protein